MRFTSFTVDNGWALHHGKLCDPDTLEPLAGKRLEGALNSYNVFSTLKVAYGALKDPRDKAFADQIIAAWAAEGYA